VEQVLVIRPELLKALFEVWEVDNLDDLMLKMAKYEADKQIRSSFTVADPTLTVFHEPIDVEHPDR